MCAPLIFRLGDQSNEVLAVIGLHGDPQIVAPLAGPLGGTSVTSAAHSLIDYATRLLYEEMLPDEKGVTATWFLRRAAAWFAATGSISSG